MDARGSDSHMLDHYSDSFGGSTKGPWLGPGCVIFILGVTGCIVAELLGLYAMKSKKQHGSEPAADHTVVGAAESASDPLHSTSHEARYSTHLILIMLHVECTYNAPAHADLLM